MIDYSIVDPLLFIQKMEAVQKIMDEGWMEFGGKIRVVGTDPSRIAIFEFLLGKEFLNIHEDDDISMPVQMFDLYKMLSRLKKTESLRIRYVEEDNLMTIIGKVNGRKKTFKLPAVDLDEDDELPINDLLGMPLNATFYAEIADIKDMVEDCEALSDIVEIGTREGRVLFKASYVGGSQVTSELPVEDIIAGEEAAYSVRYMKQMVASMAGERALFRFGTDKPLVAYSKIGDNSRMIYFLAPRVEEADFEDDDYD